MKVHNVTGTISAYEQSRVSLASAYRGPAAGRAPSEGERGEANADWHRH
jgi:hypothetical protein